MSEDRRAPRAEGERSLMLRRDAPSRGPWLCLAWRTSRDPPGCPPPAGPRLAPPCRCAAVWRHTQARGGDQRRGERTRGATRQAALRGLPQAARSRAAVASRRATWARGGGGPIAGVQKTTIRTFTVNEREETEGLRPHIRWTEMPDFVHIYGRISPMNRACFPTSAVCLVRPAKARRVFQRG